MYDINVASELMYELMDELMYELMYELSCMN